MLAQQLQNIPKFHLVDTSNPQSSSDSKYITRFIFAYADFETRDSNYILEMCEQQLLSGLLPSDGLDPFIIEFQHYFVCEDNPQRCYLFLYIASHFF